MIASPGGCLADDAVEWLVGWYFRSVEVVCLDGDGGVGKTSLMLAVAAALSRGAAPVETLYLHRCSESDNALEAVYWASGGVPGMISYCSDPELFLDKAGVALLEDLIVRGGYGLVVCDPLRSFVPPGASRVTERLSRLAASAGVCWVNVRNTSKGRALPVPRGVSRRLVARLHPRGRGLVEVLSSGGHAFRFTRDGNQVEFRRP